MAAKKKSTKKSGPISARTGIDAASIDIEAQYHVVMRYPHKIGRTTLLPSRQHKVKGWVLMDIPPHKIVSYDPVI